MAELLAEFDWSFTSKHTSKPRGRNYPWDEYFDGGIRRLHQGTDFDGPGASFERVVRTTATRREQRVRVRVEDDSTVVMQKHDDANTERRVTRTPKRILDKYAKRAAAEKPSENGKRPRKAAASKTPAKPAAPVKATVSKSPAKNGDAPVKAAVSKRPAPKATPPRKRVASKQVAATS